MESFKDTLDELVSWVRENGYPIEKLERVNNAMHYRLDDRFYTYDLYETDGKPSLFAAALQTDSGKKAPLWSAVFINGKFFKLLSGLEMLNIVRGRRK